MKLKAVILDDESNARSLLTKLINLYCPNLEVIRDFEFPEEALAFVHENEFDVLFLDIQMPSMNGLDFIKRVKNRKFETIFTTAYDQYAIDAFKADAKDYLLKPIDEEELIKAISKVEQTKGLIDNQFEELISKLHHSSELVNKKISIPFHEGVEFVLIDHIKYCEADNNYTLVFLKDGSKRVVSKTLKEFERTLSEKIFFRVHNSYLINLNYVHKYIRTDGGYLIMDDQKKIKISRTKKESLLEKL